MGEGRKERQRGRQREERSKKRREKIIIETQKDRRYEGTDRPYISTFLSCTQPIIRIKYNLPCGLTFNPKTTFTATCQRVVCFSERKILNVAQRTKTNKKRPLFRMDELCSFSSCLFPLPILLGFLSSANRMAT